MDCVITIKGDGKGKYGRPYHDRTGPIREFMLDNATFYQAIFRHVKTCDKCSPTEILEFYLERRRTAKFEFKVSSGLLNIALSYDKFFKKVCKPVPDELIREFIWRCGSFNSEEFSDRLSLKEKLESFRLHRNSYSRSSLSGLNLALENLAELDRNSDLSEEEIRQHVDVITVINS